MTWTGEAKETLPPPTEDERTAEAGSWAAAGSGIFAIGTSKILDETGWMPGLPGGVLLLFAGLGMVLYGFRHHLRGNPEARDPEQPPDLEPKARRLGIFRLGYAAGRFGGRSRG